MIYALLRLIVKIALRVFYTNVEVKTKAPIPAKGPLIVVANHPNTFMDPIVIASILPQQVYFLTNGSVFKNPVIGWLLSKMNMIPIYRKQDVDGQTPDNRASFARCFDFLANKGTLLIFPEGSSVNERRLRKLKTGTARIALGAEAELNFNLGIQILTIGLNYSDPERFRSELFINVDKPILVKDFAESYLKDPYEAVNQLTEQLRLRLESHLIITRDEEEDNLVQAIEMIYKDRLSDLLDVDSEEEEFLLTQHIVEAIRYFEAYRPEKLITLRQKMADYTLSLKRLRLQDSAFVAEKRKKQPLVGDKFAAVHCFGFSLVPLWPHQQLHPLHYSIQSSQAHYQRRSIYGTYYDDHRYFQLQRMLCYFYFAISSMDRQCLVADRAVCTEFAGKRLSGVTLLESFDKFL
jgi:1-acyl-sn-glycerol-3-phosphate acyltransferase